jgi:TIR domain
MAIVFFSYSHKDEGYRDRLETSLKTLERQGLISSFHDRRIPPGDILDHAISSEMERADIILLLVSSDFLASDYCMDREMVRALERQKMGAARVIPIILRPCDWQQTELKDLKALPEDGRPVSKFPDLDDAFFQITTGIRQAVMLVSSGNPPPKTPPAKAAADEPRSLGPRSSNLQLKKSFTDFDRDRFKEEAFEFMARFFENSLKELSSRNDGVHTSFRRIDANQFTASVYRDGKKTTFCRIMTGGAHFGGDIMYSAGEHMSEGSYNETMSVRSEDSEIYLSAVGMPMHGRRQDARLTFEGAAEYYWGLFIGELQR